MNAIYLTTLSAVLASLIVVLQFVAPSRTTFRVATALCGLLFIVTSILSYKQIRSEELKVESLKKIATRVDWEQSAAYLKFVNAPKGLSDEDIQVSIKIFTSTTQFPVNNIDLKEINSSAEISRFEYKALSDKVSELLWKSYVSTDGSISLNEEKSAGVEHLLYYQSSSIVDSMGSANVSLDLVWGPNARSNMISLIDLNDSCLAARINVGAIEKPIMSELTLVLKSNSGNQLLYMPVRSPTIANNETVSRDRYQSIRFVGLCIPDEFFQI